eukprot:XP_011660924.1 PREDICTED: microtubule-associated protein 4 isoform X13 [Strongylocentrotus purpuratus]
MPQAETSPAQNIYDLQSSWPQQPHAGNEDTQRQPDDHLNQEETIPAEVISDRYDEERDQDYPEETLGYVHSEQNLEEDEVEKVDETGSGDYSGQDHLDPYDAETADHLDQKGIETEKDSLQENLNLQEAVTATVLSTEGTTDHLQQEHEDPQEAATADYPEEEGIGKEKDTREEHLNVQEAATVDHIEQKDIATEKDYVDSFEATTYSSEQKDSEFEKDTPQGLVDPYATTEIDYSEQKDIEKEKETPNEYQDPYGAAHAAQQVTTEMQQDPVQTSGDPYSSEQILVGLNEKEEVQQPTEIYQEYAQGSIEPATTKEHEVVIDQEDLQKSEEIAQEYPPERVDSFEKVQGEKEEDITHLRGVEHPCESMEEEKDIDEMSGASHIPQESISLTEASYMQTPMHPEEQGEKEDLGLEHQEHAEEEQEQEQEQLLDPHAPEIADMADIGDNLRPKDSEPLGDVDQPAQQGNIPQDYGDTLLIEAEVGEKEAETEFTALATLEEKDMADEQQVHEDDHVLAQTRDDQVESGNMQPEMSIDPIDAVFRANSQENLLGLDPEAAVFEPKKDETAPENLEPVLESDQNVTPAQPDVVHAPSYDREDANVDLSYDQDTVVSAEVDTESFQSGPVIQSSDPLVSQGLSQIDIEPSQQSAEDLSIPTAPVNVQESDDYNGDEYQDERVEPDRYEEGQGEPDRSEEEYEEEAREPTPQGNASNLPLLDLGDGPVQSLSLADVNQSPGQHSFEGSFSPIEDNVAVSLALEDQAHVVESGEQEESDDANTETTEVEADNFEQEIQHEVEPAYNTPKEVPTEAEGHEEDLHDNILSEGKDTSEVPQYEIADTNVDESHSGLVQDKVEVCPDQHDTMQTPVETYLEENEKADDEYNQIQQELPEDSMAGVDGDGLDKREEFSSAAEKTSQEVYPEPCEQATPEIVMQEYSEEELETEETPYTAPDVSTDTTLQNTADKLLGDPEEDDALIMERSRASATPPNTPEVILPSPPEMLPPQALFQETMQKEGEAAEDQLAPEAEQLAPYDDLIVQSEEKQEPSTEEPVVHEADEVLESAPEEPPSAASICEEKSTSSEITTPSVPLAVHTPEVPTATSAAVEAEEKEIKSSPAQQKKPKTPTGTKSPSKKPSPSAAQKAKSSVKHKGSDTPKKTAALSRSQPKATAPGERKETAKAPSKSPTKSPSKIPSKTPAKVPPAKVPPAKVPAVKTPAKASPKVSAPAPARPASSAKRTPGSSVGATATRPKTAPHKVDTKPIESKPKQDKVKMSGVKQKTVTTVTKTTHTEVRSANSSPRKSADGDSPRVRHSPGRNGAASKIGSLDNSRHSPGGGNVKIQSEKSNYSRVQSKCGSLGNSTHRAGGGNVKIFDERVDFRTRANSRVGSLDNAHHSPGGGSVKILHDPVTFSKPSSRVGSLENAHHSPHGGKVKILHDPVAFPKSSVSSKIGSLDNAQHSPGGGNVKITSASMDFSKKAKSKIGSLDNAHHSPKGGNVKILNQSADYSKTVKSKIGSLDNATHSPGGGNVKIEKKKVDFGKKVTSKIGSLDNATHKPGGGKVKIEKKKLDFKDKAASKIGSKDNIKHQAGGGQVKIENKKLDFKVKATSKIGSKDNIEHKPGGGQVKIQEEKLEFKAKASSKIGSLDNASHKPGGGDVHILDEKLEFSTKAQSKVGSMDNADHQPSGGDVKIFDEKPTFQHASPRTDEHDDDGIH